MTGHAQENTHLTARQADALAPAEVFHDGDALQDEEASHDEEALTRTAGVFKALSTVSRLRLLTQLAHGPSGVTDLSIDTGLAQPLVSAHLKVLRELRLVKVERLGRTARYSLSDDHVAHVIADALAHSKEELSP